MSRICIIPARGGSKRIPRKNIKEFLGIPIIAYSIKAALESNLFDEVMVSTDDEEIASIAVVYGAKVPFLRSIENSDDYATTVDVLLEVVEKYTSNSFDSLCCIYPTAPFVTAKKLKEACSLLETNKLDSVFPIIEFSYPIQRALKIENELVRLANSEYEKSRSQDLPKRYHDAGQFYFCNVKALLESNTIFTDNSSAIVVSELSAQDIDNEVDWRLAELKFQLQ